MESINESINDFQPKSEILKPKPILHVPKDFGIPNEISFFTRGMSVSEEKKILNIFETNGFTIDMGSSFDNKNPSEIGIFCGNNPNNIEIAKEIGVLVPEKISVAKVLETNNPIVAKATYADMGESKYLLETHEQKNKFITWLIAKNKGIFQFDYSLQEARSFLFELSNRGLNGNFDKDLINEIDESKKWVFEKYIETPSNYNTSFRVVADGFGNFYYCQLNRSGEEKRKVKNATNPNKHVLVFEDRIATDSIESLLTHPRSPFFLDSYKFTSNIAQGGSQILLDGKKVNSPVDQRVLTSHGINPNNPLPPKELLEFGAKAAIINRDNYPYSGIDFLMNKQKDFLYLETNSCPMLNANGLGLRSNSTDSEKNFEIMKHIAKKVK